MATWTDIFGGKTEPHLTQRHTWRLVIEGHRDAMVAKHAHAPTLPVPAGAGVTIWYTSETAALRAAALYGAAIAHEQGKAGRNLMPPAVYRY